jgi:hypothetical protein
MLKMFCFKFRKVLSLATEPIINENVDNDLNLRQFDLQGFFRLKIGFGTIILSSKNLGIRLPPYQTQIQISLVPCALLQAFEGSEVEPGMPC